MALERIGTTVAKNCSKSTTRKQEVVNGTVMSNLEKNMAYDPNQVRLAWQVEGEKCRLKSVCREVEQVLLLKDTSRSRTGDILAKFSGRKAEIIDMYRGGNISIEEMRKEIESSVHDLKQDIKPRGRAVFTGDDVERAHVSCDGSHVVVSITTPSNNTAAVVGLSTDQIIGNLCAALDAISHEKSQSCYTIRIDFPRSGTQNKTNGSQKRETRTWHITDYPMVCALMRVIAEDVLSTQVAPAVREDSARDPPRQHKETVQLDAQGLTAKIRLAESKSHRAKWRHSPGALYCENLVSVSKGCMHHRVRQGLPSHSVASVGKNDEAVRDGQVTLVQSRRVIPPVNDNQPARSLSSATESFPIYHETRIRYMCATCEGSFPTEERLADHTCTCVHCRDAIHRKDVSKHMQTCRNRPYTCPRCDASETEFYGPRARETWIVDHDKVCPVQAVQCPHGCGDTFMPQRMGESEQWLESHVCLVPCEYCHVRIAPDLKEQHIQDECMLAPLECECGEIFVPKVAGDADIWRASHVCRVGTCTMCKHEFPLGAQFTAHKLECPRRPIECSMCDRVLFSFPRKFANRDVFLAHHQASECEMRPVVCKACRMEHVPQVIGERAIWQESHVHECACREAICADCNASFQPKKVGQREKWIQRHAEKCPNRAAACLKCGESSRGPFLSPEAREFWIENHAKNVCPFRPMTCTACGETYTSESADALAQCDAQHRCALVRTCEWCRGNVHVLGSPYTHRGRQEMLYSKYSKVCRVDEKGEDVRGMSMEGMLAMNVWLGMLNEEPLKEWRRTHIRRDEWAAFADAFTSALKESNPGEKIDIHTGMLTYAQFLSAVKMLDHVIVDEPMREHKRTCPLRPVRCAACGQTYRPANLGGGQRWLEMHQISACPMRTVTCSACGEHFTPSAPGQIDEWRTAHLRVCQEGRQSRRRGGRIAAGHKQEGRICMCSSCVALRKVAKCKFREGVKEWVKQYRQRAADAELKEYAPPPPEEDADHWSKRLSAAVVEGTKSKNERPSGLVLRQEPEIEWDYDEGKPALALVAATSFDLTGGKHRRRAEEMRAERMERSRKEKIWSKPVITAAELVPKCAGLSVVKCEVCRGTHTVTQCGKRAQAWMESHQGVCAVCGGTSVCSEHKCLPPAVPQTVCPVVPPGPVVRTDARPEHVHTRPGSAPPLSVIVPSFLGKVGSPLGVPYWAPWVENEESDGSCGRRSSDCHQKSAVDPEKKPSYVARSALSPTPAYTVRPILSAKPARAPRQNNSLVSVTSHSVTLLPADKRTRPSSATPESAHKRPPSSTYLDSISTSLYAEKRPSVSLIPKAATLGIPTKTPSSSTYGATKSADCPPWVRTAQESLEDEAQYKTSQSDSACAAVSYSQPIRSDGGGSYGLRGVGYAAKRTKVWDIPAESTLSRSGSKARDVNADVDRHILSVKMVYL